MALSAMRRLGGKSKDKGHDRDHLDVGKDPSESPSPRDASKKMLKRQARNRMSMRFTAAHDMFGQNVEQSYHRDLPLLIGRRKQQTELHGHLTKHLKMAEKSAELGRVVGKNMLKFSAFCDEDEEDLGGWLEQAGELVKTVHELQANLYSSLLEDADVAERMATKDMEYVKEMKKRQEKAVALWEVSEKKVQEVQTKQGQTNILRLTEAEDERDKAHTAALGLSSRVELSMEQAKLRLRRETMTQLENYVRRTNDYFVQGMAAMEEVMQQVETLKGRIAEIEEQSQARMSSDIEGAQSPMAPAAVAATTSPLGSPLSGDSGSPIMPLRKSSLAAPARRVTVSSFSMPDLSEFTYHNVVLESGKKKKGESCTVIVRILSKSIVVGENSSDIAALLGISKHPTISNRVLVLWQGTGSSEVKESMTFQTTEARESFYQAVWAAKLSQSIATREGRHKITMPRTQQKLKVFVGAWNMDATTPPDDLSSWLPKDDFDVYVVGVQNCDYVSKKAGVKCEVDWFSMLQAHFGKGYIKIEGVSNLSNRLIILSKREHFFKVSCVETARETIGSRECGGIFSTIALTFFDTSLCFLNAQICGAMSLEERNDIIMSAIPKMGLGVKDMSDLSNKFDYLYVLGELGYSLANLSYDKLMKHVNSKRPNFKSVAFNNDELLQSIRREDVFVGYYEPEIDFPPTCHFVAGPPDPTTGVSEMHYSAAKTPGYGTRVLCRARPGLDISGDSYSSAPMSSNHLPIGGSYTLDLLLPPPPRLQKPYDPMRDSVRVKISSAQVEAGSILSSSIAESKGVAYLSYSAGFLPTTYRSMGSTELRWRMSELPILEPHVNSPEYLQLQHVLVIVRAKGEPLASCALPLKPLVDQEGEMVDCTLSLVHNGKPSGTLKISLCLEFGIAAPALVDLSGGRSSSDDELTPALGFGPMSVGYGDLDRAAPPPVSITDEMLAKILEEDDEEGSSTQSGGSADFVSIPSPSTQRKKFLGSLSGHRSSSKEK